MTQSPKTYFHRVFQIMGCYMLIYSTFAHTIPWPDKLRDQPPSSTTKNRSTRYSKLLSISYEESDSDKAASKPEPRVSVGTGYRESKSCDSCNSVPWMPVVKFSQRAPKNIIYQEEPDHEGLKMHLLPPPLQSYTGIKGATNFHQHDSLPQFSEVKPILTPCDLLKHNHDSLDSGSEAVSSVQHYQDHGVNNFNKWPHSNPDTSFRYYSYIKHPETPPRNNFTRPQFPVPWKPPNNYHGHSTTPPIGVRNQPTNYATNQPYNKRGKDLFHIMNDYGTGVRQYDQYDNNKFIEHQYVKPTQIYDLPYQKIPTNLLTQENPFINQRESYKIPTVLPNTEDVNVYHYPAHFETDITQLKTTYGNENSYQNQLENSTNFQSTSFDNDVPMQYLTPPKMVSGNREGKKYEHYTMTDNDENTNAYQTYEQEQQFNKQDIYSQHDAVSHLNSVDDRAAQLQNLNHKHNDLSELPYDENKLKTFSAYEWQCFLMNFIKYLKMSKAGHTVKMNHECDPITLQNFILNLNINEQKHNEDEIISNEIQSDEEDDTKLVQNANHYTEDQNEIGDFEEYQHDPKNLIASQHELVKLAPHLSGEYHIDNEFVKNYSQVAQEAVNNFIRQNELTNGNDQSNDPILLEPIWNPQKNHKTVSNDQVKHQKQIKDSKTNHTKSIGNTNDDQKNSYYVPKFNESPINTENVKEEHYLNNQEIINNNNMFQDMLENYTEESIIPEDEISSTTYESESYTRNAEKSTPDSLDISSLNAIPYPKGFSFTKDQSNFVTEKPILLTSPKKIKIVIPYRKASHSDLKRENNGKYNFLF